MPDDEREPFTLCIRKSELTIYNRLRAEDSPFSGLTRKKMFLLSMANGFREGKFSEVSSERETYVRNEYLFPEDRAIIDAIAVSKSGGLEILADTRKVFAIAEGYASGGLKSLCEQVFEGEFGTYSKRLEADIRSYAKKNLEGMRTEPQE
jgi:hypothetical protein